MSELQVVTALPLLLLLVQPGQNYSVPLSGRWTLSDGDGIVHFNLTSTGTDAYSVLQEIGIISDPLSGYGDKELRYISYKNWTFSHYFRVEYPKVLKTTSLELNELDTFCCIYLNNRLLACTENSFIRTILPIDSVLCRGWNFLQLVFKPTPLMAKEAYQKLSPNPPLPACWPDIFRGECYVNAVRTTQAAFGWDWGPAFPIQGFWKLPFLRFDEVWLGDGLRFFPVMIKRGWKATVSVEVLRSSSIVRTDQCVCIYVKLGGGLMHEWTERCISPRHRETNVWLELPLASNATVRPWWPLGVQAGPHLYALKVQLRNPLGGPPIDRKSFWVGFREVKLIQDDVKVEERGYGKTFFFRINGEPLFVRGSNWIPARLFAGGGTDAVVMEAHLLQSAALGGVQMLRVWGGGRYEARRFYDLASRLGIMLWHDMMFACAMYKKPPSGEVDSAETEVRQQVRRLHHHPAIVVWATNNEVEVAAAQHWYGPKIDKQEYRRRFLDSIATIAMRSEIPTVQSPGYIPRRVLLSSPSNAESSTDPYGIDLNPQDPLSGDVHFYSYYEDLWDECTYPVTRFTSEYGIMSLPGPLAWLRSLDNSSSRPDDWMIRGQLMMHRLHKTDGIDILQRFIREKFGEPKVGQSKEETYTIWTYLTQLYQAIAYKTHINLLERHQCTIFTGVPNDSWDCISTGQGRSMGHLYWQLNDVWAAPTWSTIDVAGQWKIAHYLAIRGTASITHPIGRAVVSRVRNRVLVNWVPPINPPTDNRIRLSVVCSSILSFVPQPKVLFQSGDNFGPWKPNGCPLEVTNFTMKWLLSSCPSGVLTTVIENAVEQTNDTVLLLTPKEMAHQWPATAGSVSVTSVRRVNTTPPEIPSPPFRWDQAFEVKLRAKSPEIFVWLVIDPYINLDGWFSNSAFNMLTCEEHSLYYYIKGRIPVFEKRLWKAIRIYTLASIASSR
ncbi:beta mannosidase [Echinococcus multilocularis]|uniref:beta-mannosidase n=1 Tax=Echinococcus multilocularis TaxID=6211 RepID=A0A068Y697_ECHMU|nr:beta mannosidase [Echinococcus multilocularis]